MKIWDRLILLGVVMGMGMLVISPAYSMYEIKPNDKSFNIIGAEDVKYTVNFYSFSTSSSTPSVSASYSISSGSKVGSIVNSVPSVTTNLGTYMADGYWSSSLDFTDSLNSSSILNKYVSSNLNFYPRYVGYFAANSASSSEKVGLPYSSTNTYASSESTYSSTSYYIYKNMKGSSTYEAVSDKKTIYCEAVNGATKGNYTFNYNSSTKATNAIRRFYYQSHNNDFPSGSDPRIHMWADEGASTTWPGVTMSWVTDIDSNNKLWYYDIDSTLYEKFMITKKWGSGDSDVWKVQYNNNGITEFKFRSGTNMLALSSQYTATWYTR